MIFFTIKNFNLELVLLVEYSTIQLMYAKIRIFGKLFFLVVFSVLGSKFARHDSRFRLILPLILPVILTRPKNASKFGRMVPKFLKNYKKKKFFQKSLF